MRAKTIVVARRKRIKPRQHSGTSGLMVRRLENITIGLKKRISRPTYGATGATGITGTTGTDPSAGCCRRKIDINMFFAINDQ